MKKDFFTGLALLLPVAITVAIVFFIINLITNPFVNGVSALLDHWNIFNKPFFIFSGQQVLMFASKILVLLALVLIVFLVGMFGRFFIIKHIVRAGEHVIHQIPFVNRIYKSIREIVHTIFGHSEQQRFSSVVLVPFPHSEMLSVGLVASEDVAPGSDPDYQGMVSVFVPGTPNPAMGFMLLFRREQLIPIDMRVQDALKFVISCGVVMKAEEKGPA